MRFDRRWVKSRNIDVYIYLYMHLHLYAYILIYVYGYGLGWTFHRNKETKPEHWPARKQYTTPVTRLLHRGALVNGNGLKSPRQRTRKPLPHMREIDVSVVDDVVGLCATRCDLTDIRHSGSEQKFHFCAPAAITSYLREEKRRLAPHPSIHVSIYLSTDRSSYLCTDVRHSSTEHKFHLCTPATITPHLR